MGTHLPAPSVPRSARVLCAGIACCCTLFAGSQIAQAVTIVNPGFEDITGESPFNEFTFGPLNGWDLYDPNNITGGGAGGTYYIGTLTPDPPTNFTNGAPEGQRVAIAFNFFGSGGQGEYGLSQTSNEQLPPNTAYRLSVDIGNIASGTAQNGQFFNLDGFPGYRVEIYVGGEIVTQDDNTFEGFIPEGQFATTVRNFYTDDTPGQGFEIRLINLNEVDPLHPNADLEVDFDNVRLVQIAGLIGDLDADGFVGIGDLNIILGHWNQNVPPNAMLMGDTSGDGFVGIEDLGDVLGNWNADTPPTSSAIPEPTAWAIFSLTASAIFARHRHTSPRR